MRREYKQEQDYIAWLRSIGCTLYSPFQGDLENKIDGQTWYVSDGISSLIATDDYAILTSPMEQSINSRAAAMINTTVHPNIEVGQPVNSAPITLIGEAMVVNNSTVNNGGRYTSFISDGGSTSSNGALTNINQYAFYGMCVPGSHYAPGTTTTQTSMPMSFQWRAGILDSSTNKQIFYKDGIYEWQTNNGRTMAITSVLRNHACMCLEKCTATTTFYVKNCYSFAAALTAEQMLKIYQHDQQ